MSVIVIDVTSIFQVVLYKSITKFYSYSLSSVPRANANPTTVACETVPGNVVSTAPSTVFDSTVDALTDNTSAI